METSVESSRAPRSLTVEEVAARLAVSPYTVRLWCRTRRMPSTKLGRMVRIPESALDSWLMERTTTI